LTTLQPFDGGLLPALQICLNTCLNSRLNYIPHTPDGSPPLVCHETNHGPPTLYCEASPHKTSVFFLSDPQKGPFFTNPLPLAHIALLHNHQPLNIAEFSKQSTPPPVCLVPAQLDVPFGHLLVHPETGPPSRHNVSKSVRYGSLFGRFFSVFYPKSFLFLSPSSGFGPLGSRSL